MRNNVLHPGVRAGFRNTKIRIFVHPNAKTQRTRHGRLCAVSTRCLCPGVVARARGKSPPFKASKLDRSGLEKETKGPQDLPKPQPVRLHVVPQVRVCPGKLT